MIGLDPNDARPAYRQVADLLRKQVERGDLSPGDQLPPHHLLADEYDVSTETIKRALGELRNAGVIVTRQGKGSYVRSSSPDAEADTRPEADLAKQVAGLRAELDVVKTRLDTLEKRTGLD